MKPEVRAMHAMLKRRTEDRAAPLAGSLSSHEGTRNVPPSSGLRVGRKAAPKAAP